MGLLQERFKSYREPQKYMEMGVYPYFRSISGKQGTEVEMEGKKVLMFGSNAYTGLTGDQRIIDAAKEALDKYGSGCAGSRCGKRTGDRSGPVHGGRSFPVREKRRGGRRL